MELREVQQKKILIIREVHEKTHIAKKSQQPKIITNQKTAANPIW
jgi:hypothetical protein